MSDIRPHIRLVRVWPIAALALLALIAGALHLAGGPDAAARAATDEAATQPATGRQPTTAATTPRTDGSDASTEGKSRSDGSADNSKTLDDLGIFPTDDGADLGGLLARMLAATLVIVVIGGVAIYLLKRVLPRVGRRGGRRIQVEETSYLGPRKAVHLLKVGSRRLLVGSSKDGIHRIEDVTDAFGPDYDAVAREVERDSQDDAGNARGA